VQAKGRGQQESGKNAPPTISNGILCKYPGAGVMSRRLIDMESG
jgi:hypothetical protein